MEENVCVVKVSEKFLPEKEYLADVIFNQLLGIPYRLVIDSTLSDTYVIDVNGKQVILTDDFFSRASDAKGYLTKSLIPTRVELVRNDFVIDGDVPLLFGKSAISVSQDKIECGHDIFAAVFFMLTRWEEAVITETDYLNRFPAGSALAVKFNFLHRPVVNEWIGMLAKMIRHLQPEIQFSQPQSYGINFTHDIDFLNAPVTVREFAKDVVRRKSLRAISTRAGYLLKGKNPHDLFDYFMDVSEKHNTVSRFNFMTGHNVPGRDGENYNGSSFYKKILGRIRERGHVIGFHPSLNSYNDPEMFAKEKSILEKDAGQKVTEGRQHALRFKMPETWNMWEESGMIMDSTLGYSAMEGFRCGTGCVYSAFDVVKGKPLKLKEMPLVMMDTTLHVNRKINLEESARIIRYYIDTGKKYNMPVTFLFHNSIDEQIDWKNWKSLYDELFNN